MWPTARPVLTGATDAISVDPMKDVKEADGVADEDNAGAYSARKFVSNYHPFNNERLATYSYTYNLTIKSPIKEGKQKGITGKSLSLDIAARTAQQRRTAARRQAC